MCKRAILALVVVMCLAAPVAVKAQEDNLDEVYTARVKPEKLANFQELFKKWADANRSNGDHWLTLTTFYGEGDVYVFVSPRQTYADIDKGSAASARATIKAYGQEAADKMGSDFENCLVWSRNELRRRRPDLSRKAPTDMESYAKLIGESRVLRMTAVHVKAGHIAEFEALLKELKEAGEKNPDTQPVLVSQVIEGGQGTTFYITTLRSSLADFDNTPAMRDLLGEEGFRKFQQENAEMVETTDSALYRFAAGLSSPSEEVVKVAPEFWQPKATMVAAHKARAAGSTTPAAGKPKP